MFAALFASFAAATDPLDDADDIVLDRPELLDRAWLAMAHCTGNAPPDVQGIAFTTADEIHGRAAYAGTTWIDDADRRIRIVVRRGEEDDPLVMLHELAHHWVGWEPRALGEGLSELLAECAYRELSGASSSLRVDHAIVQTRIFAWQTDDALEDGEVAAHYRDAYLLARVLARLLPPEELWNPASGGGWPDLWGAVERHHNLSSTWDEGPRPAPDSVDSASVRLAFTDLEVMRVAWPLRWSVAMEDVDGDGLVGRQERERGTSPLSWDTDGDGFWDGADPPPGAFALPADDACIGVAPEGGSTVALGGPDLGGWLATIPFNGAGMLVIAGAHRTRLWGTVTGGALAPCDPEPPPTGGVWPMAVVDADGDGVLRVDERAAGTDPDRYDTDGDGFWDGAQPPPGATPLGPRGLRCLAWPTRQHPRFGRVGIGGPDHDEVQLSALELGAARGQTRLALRVDAPPRSKAWISGLPAGYAPCADFAALREGRVCVGVARAAGKVELEVQGPDRGEVNVEPLVATVGRGDPVYVQVTREPGFSGKAWVTPGRRLDPCPPE